ncbi:unnamed protein product [Sphagnum compactum]
MEAAVSDSSSSSSCSSWIRSSFSFEPPPQELIPGLPDSVVTHSVLPRLPWFVRPRLLSVSKSWRSILERPANYINLTRRLCHTAGLLVIHQLPPNEPTIEEEKDEEGTISSADDDMQQFLERRNYCCWDGCHGQRQEFIVSSSSCRQMTTRYTISMLDPDNNTWHRLPPIHGCPSGIPALCSFVCAKGKLILMGGVPDSVREHESSEVYALDLGGGLWWWEKCASMHSTRAFSKSVFLAGQVYVLGGTCPGEVYDMEEDKWQRLPQMVDSQFFCNGVLGLETQILAYGYDIVDPGQITTTASDIVNSARILDTVSGCWSSVEFGHAKCCAAVMDGNFIFEMVRGFLIQHDTAANLYFVYDGKLEVQPKVNSEVDTKGTQSAAQMLSCQVHDLVVAEQVVDCDRPGLLVYTLASLGQNDDMDSHACRSLWRAALNHPPTIATTLEPVVWEEILCPFLLTAPSDSLSQMAYFSS